MRYLRLAILSLLLCGSANADIIKHIAAGTTDQTITLRIIDATDGTPETGVVFNTSGIDLEYWRHGANSAVDITEVTQTVNGAHTDGGFVHIGHGFYRLDLPDAAVAAAVGTFAVEVYGTVTGMIVLGGTVALSPPVNVVAFGGTTGQFAGGRPEVNMSHISGDSNAADELELAFDGATGSVESLGIVRQGTAQSATSTTLVLDSAAAFADDATIGMTLLACGSTQGYCVSEVITDYVNSTDTATVNTWSVTPSGTITYYLFGTATVAGSSGSGATAQEVWEYSTRTITSLDEDTTTMDLNSTPVGSLTTAPTIAWNPAWDAEVQSEAADAINADTGDSFTAIPWNASWDAEVQSEAADALNAYDPPTRTELASDIATLDALLNTLILGVNVIEQVGIPICGSGTEADPWGACP
jgi:hypothetical protein